MEFCNFREPALEKKSEGANSDRSRFVPVITDIRSLLPGPGADRAGAALALSESHAHAALMLHPPDTVA